MTLTFAGATYESEEDDARLISQLGRVYAVMRDCEWRTLDEISELTGDPPASVSAQLRHLRKKRFGGYSVDKRTRGLRSSGLYEYCVLPPGTPTTWVAPKRRKVKNPFLAGMIFAAKTIKGECDLTSAKHALGVEIRKVLAK